MKIIKLPYLLTLAVLVLINTPLSSQESELELTYLGAAGWKVVTNEVTILIDPYITRKNYSQRRDSIAVSDTDLIDKHIKEADYILVHHGHPDHLMDVPYIAKKTGAKVIGTETTMNILKAYDIDRDNLYTVKGGEDYQFESFSVRVIPSLHSPLSQKRYFDSSRYTEPLAQPVKYSDMKEGGSLMFLLRINDTEILTMGSMNFIEREIQGLSPNVLLAGSANSRLNIYKYTERLLSLTNYPGIVIPTHWDNFSVPYDDKEAQQQARKAKVDPFVNEVKELSPDIRVIIPEHLKSIKIK
ncbi:MAG: MBL fold metallo-hydrolase [Balneolaceae bacterium]|nr:MBL fold metallo-hydrolase [Balneolaceae bacterium]MBO6547427.1 MBL fold metallo-hydrolase [Balneolaceae bacterium]MBO6647626.1 MBL fold metallo-hydrolase [Balneolaceae bacterium]